MDARPAPALPTEVSLHEAALNHLARYATTAAGLVRVLDRRVDRYVRAGGDAEAGAKAKIAVRAVVARLVGKGLVDDAAFAANRARSLARAGRSRRAVAAHLAVRGVAAEVARGALVEDAEDELAAALILARKRRLGPYGSGDSDPVVRHKALGTLARAGFSQEIARRALGLGRDEAEARIHRFRQNG
jgi:regulatory protein